MVAKARRKTAEPLADYNAKRDFAKTKEPRGELKAVSAPSSRPILTIQKHDATRLHWDLRLEVDGVLKSWAVTRGPSADPEIKRLAVRTEDHPIDYAEFEGTIPEKEYGGGTVMLWDFGWWEPITGKSAGTLNEGHLHFIAHGKRMRGEWILVRLKPREGERGENWLLRKVEDKYVEAGDSLIERALTSVSTGRTMDKIAAGGPTPKKPKPRPSTRRKKMPKFRPPMLARLTEHLPEGEEWLFEVKFDGYRALVAAGSDGAIGWTRSGLDWSKEFAPVVKAVAALPARSLLVDGEIVILGENGQPDFSELANHLRDAPERLLYFVFDLLERDGEDLADRPLIERKAMLADLLADAPAPLHYSDHVTGDGSPLLKSMADNGLEGVIAKRASSPYRSARNGDWLKIKVDRREEFIVVGYTPSDKRGKTFASLLLAQHDGKALVYKGRVGTGFNETSSAKIASHLKPVAKPPVINPNLALESGQSRARGRAKPVWIRPKLVAEVRYAEYTGDDVLRHASFIGLREDKAPADVVPEKAMKRTEPAKSWTAPTPSIAITNPDRELFGKGGPTKGDLASWYEAIAPFALPWLADRPLALVRCPQGATGQCFFQKHLKKGWGKAVGSIMIEEADGATEPTVVVYDKEGMLQCVQMGTIEFHGWGAPAKSFETPDRLAIDLDPDEGLDFKTVKQAAKAIHDHLADVGLATWPMLTGGKGVHVIAPLDQSSDWDAVEDFAKRFALALEQTEPQRYTASMAKARRKGRIFVDWMRNRRGSTAIMPWSVRARESAGIAAPLSWDQLAEWSSAAHFTLRDPAAAFAQAQGLESGWCKASQSLPDR